METEEQIVTETPKRRGRPPKVREAAPTQEVPHAIPDETPTAEKARRGRKPRAKKEPIDTNVLARQLMGVHLIAAKVAKMPELAIDAEESELLAKGIAGVLVEYDIPMSGKTAAWLGLLGAAAMVYAPRAVVIAEKKREASNPQAVPSQAQPHMVEPVGGYATA